MSHHTQQFLVMTNYPYTRMLGQHVSSHLTGRNFDKYHFLFGVNPVPNEVVLRKDLLGASMVNRVVNQIQSRLAVEVDTNRGGDANLALHLKLKLSKKAGLLPSHGQPHVLTFARAEAGIPHQFTLPADRPPS